MRFSSFIAHDEVGIFTHKTPYGSPIEKH